MRTSTAIKLVLLGLVFVAVGVAVKVVAHYTAPEQVRLLVLDALEGAVEGDVSVRSARLELPMLHLEGVTITPPGSAEPLLDCPRITVTFDAARLLRLKPVPSKVVLWDVVVDLRETEGGRWNFEGLVATGEGGKGGPVAEGLLADGVHLENASLTVSSASTFGSSEVRRYDGVYVDATPDGSSAARWHLGVRVLEGPAAGLSASGWAGTEGFRLALSGATRVDEAFWRALPAGEDIWADFQAVGRVTVQGVLQTLPDGKLDYNVDVEAAVDLQPSYFPKRVHAVTGSVRTSRSGVHVRQVTGLIGPEEFGLESGERPATTVRFDGVLSDRTGMQMVIEARGLPLCRGSLEAVPSAGPDLWEQLKPSGEADLVLRLSQSSHDAPMQYVAEARLRGVTLRPVELPVPLEAVNGTVVVDGASIRLQDVRGRLSAHGASADRPALFSLDGSLGIGSGPTHLLVQGRGLPLSRGILESVPGIGPELWERLKPSGEADLVLRLSQSSHDAPMQYVAEARLRGVTLRPVELPVPLEAANGTVVVDGASVRFQGVRGSLPGCGASADRPAFLSLDGSVGIGTEPTRLQVEARALRTSEELLAALPAGKQVWEMLKPEVLVDARVILTGDAGVEALALDAVLQVHGGRVEPEVPAFPLTDLVGVVRLTGQQVLIEHLTATVDTAAEPGRSVKSAGTVAMRGVVDLAADRARIHVRTGDIMLTEGLLKAIPGIGETVWNELRPLGVVSLMGKIVHDGADETPWRYFMGVDLKDVTMAPSYMPFPVDAFAGQLLVTERRAVSNQFTGATCGGDFEGAAVAYYGEDAEVPSFGARMTFDELELQEVVKSLTGETRDVSGRLSGGLQLGGFIGDKQSRMGKGHVSLAEGNIWRSPFFSGMLSVLRLTIPTHDEVPAHGDVTFDLNGDELDLRGFDLTASGMSLSGQGTVRLDTGALDLTIVAVGAPEKGTGIPIVTPLFDWLMRTVERQLVQVDVTGTLSAPEYTSRVLSKITWPLTSLRGLLVSPAVKGGPGATPTE